MGLRVLEAASDDLEDVVRFYRAIPPPKVGRQLAARVITEFKQAMANVIPMPLSRPVHPDIPGVRYVPFPKLEYTAFYVVEGKDVVVVAVEHSASDYVEGVRRRVATP